jgi:hypothetical protein
MRRIVINVNLSSEVVERFPQCLPSTEVHHLYNDEKSCSRDTVIVREGRTV